MKSKNRQKKPANTKVDRRHFNPGRPANPIGRGRSPFRPAKIEGVEE